MREHIPALLLGEDPAVLTNLREQLSGLDAASVVCREGSLGDGARLARENPPDIVMVVLDGDTRRGLSLLEEIGRAAPATQLFALSHDDSTETIIAAMRAGAGEFLTLPLEPAQILKALIKVVALRRLSVPTTAGELWTLYAPRGGAGVTTLAANLALELHGKGKSVCLVDLDFQSGDLALYLNVIPTYTMVDIALNFRRLDSVFLQGTLTRHPSGMYLLAATPHTGPEAAAIPADQVRAVLELLKSMYDIVIVDTPRALSDATVTAFTSATKILLLVELTLPFLRGYRHTTEVLDNLGVPKERVEVVLAKNGGVRSAVPLEEAKKTVDLTVTHTLPRDDETALAAVNRGVPLSVVKASSPLRKAIVEIGETVRQTSNHNEAPKARRKGLLSGLFAS